MNVVWAWPEDHPTVLLFAEDYRDTTPVLAWDYLTGEEIAVPANLPTRQYYRGYYDPDPPRLARVSPGRLPFRITDNFNSIPSLAAEASIPRQFVPPANHYLLIPDISGIQWVPVVIERLRYIIWDLRYSEAEIARQAERSIRVEGLAWSMEVDDATTRAITGDLLDSMRIELARGFVQETFAERGVTFTSTNMAGNEHFSIYAGNTRGIKTVALTDGQVLIVQPITAPTPIADAPNGLLRVGVIPVEASEVRWLGFIALPPDQGFTHGDHLLYLRLMRTGDQVLCSYGGLHLSGGGHEPDWHKDLHWVAFPLPPELTDLPEGELL